MGTESKRSRYRISFDSISSIKEIQSRTKPIVAWEFSRAKISEMKEIKVINQSGIYLLVGQKTVGETRFQFYLGESDNILKRIITHDSKLVFWDKALMFTRKDNTLNKAEIKYLEYLFYEDLCEVNYIDLLNKQKPREINLDEDTLDDCLDYYENIQEILILLNYINPFDFLDSESKSKKEENYVEIQLGSSRTGKTPRWKRYNLIPINTEIREFFPAYKEKFVLETDVEEIVTYVTSRTGKPNFNPKTEGKYITSKLYKWFRNHEELIPGTTLIISEIEPKKRYKLSIKE